MAAKYSSVALGEVASVRSGFAFKSGDWTESGIPVVKIANVKDGRLAMDGCSFVSPSVAASAAEFALNAGDILIAMTGHIGDVALVRSLDLPVVLNQRVGRFASRDGRRLDPLFLFYVLRTPAIRSEIESLGYGSVQPNVSPSLIHRVKVPLPPLPEQRAIAHILGTLDDKIELNRRMNATLEVIARVLFKSWFVDFDPVRAKSEGRDPGLPQHLAALFPDSFEDSEIGEVPAGWRVAALGTVMELAYGRALTEENRRPGPVAVYGASGQIGRHNEALVQGPGVVVGRKGTPGAVTWAPTDFFPIDTAFYVVPRDPRLSLPFLYYALRHHDLASFAADSAVPGLNRNLAYLSRQLVPPFPILEVFDRQVRSLFARVHRAVREEASLASLRDTLLPKLVAGQIQVKGAELVVEAPS